jgi:glycosyltransferase involved in cell wall biosynthesis
MFIKVPKSNGVNLKILIGCISFKNLTGSELYVFELAKQLVKQGCDVSVCSNIGSPLADLAKPLGIKLYSLEEPAGFKLGDGEWVIESPDGNYVSELNTLYKIKDVGFDILHLNHAPITEYLMELYPEIPTICSIHSEVIALEEPVISKQIKKYIAIRPEIKDYIVNKFGVDADAVSVIYNPIDADKFKPIAPTRIGEKKRILFVGTIDYIRQKTIEDLIKVTRKEKQELWIVGKKHDTYLDNISKKEPHVTYFEDAVDVEKYIYQCDETAGILLGRSTIEGWMCGKKGWIYDVDQKGIIKSKKLFDVPTDLDKFNSAIVAKQIIEEYKTILKL